MKKFLIKRLLSTLPYDRRKAILMEILQDVSDLHAREIFMKARPDLYVSHRPKRRKAA